MSLAHELFECDRRRVSVLVLDLTGLEFIDAAAFRLLLATGRRMRARGRHLSLANPSPEVRRILEVSALVHAADVVDELLEPRVA
jgi:anti-anti-sigma factor